MSIRTECPTCGAGFTLNDDLAGREVRCRDCKEPFVVRAKRSELADDPPPKPKKPPRDDEDDNERFRKDAPAPARNSRTRPDAPRRRSRDDDDEDGPRRTSEADDNRAPWLLMGGIGAIILTVVGFCGGGAWYVYWRVSNAVANVVPRPGDPGFRPNINQGKGDEKPKEVDPFDVPWTIRQDRLGKVADPKKPAAVDYKIPFMSPMTLSARGKPYALIATKDKQAFQVHDLLTGKEFGIQHKLTQPPFDPLILSRNGRFVGHKSTEVAHGVRAVNTQTGEAKVVTVEKPEHLGRYEFVYDDRLLIAGQVAAPWDPLPVLYQVHDVTGPRKVCEFRGPLWEPRHFTCTSNGWYMIHYVKPKDNRHLLTFFNLHNGKIEGTIPLDGVEGEVAAVAASDDCQFVTMLLRLDRRPDTWGKLVTYSTRTRGKVSEFAVGYDPPNIERLWRKGGRAVLQYTPDNTGWLLAGYRVIDGKDGKTVGTFGKPPEGEVGERLFLGKTRLTAQDGGLDPRLYAVDMSK